MYKAKYVIFDGCAVVFSPVLTHKHMVPFDAKCEGAGFVTFHNDVDTYGDTSVVAEAYGESTSLGIKSRGEQDSLIITRQITNPGM